MVLQLLNLEDSTNARTNYSINVTETRKLNFCLIVKNTINPKFFTCPLTKKNKASLFIYFFLLILLLIKAIKLDIKDQIGICSHRVLNFNLCSVN